MNTPPGYEQKFSQLIKLCVRVTGTDIGTMIIATPLVLGDTYEEVMESLVRIACADLRLVIVPPGFSAKTHPPREVDVKKACTYARKIGRTDS